MTSTPKPSIKQQRDAFLAFAMASADLLLEISDKGVISYVAGASKGLTGFQEDVLTGMKWLKLFPRAEHRKLKNMKKRSVAGVRCGPLVVQLKTKNVKHTVSITGMKLPGRTPFYITLCLSEENFLEALKRLMEELGIDPLTTGLLALDQQDSVITTGFKAEDIKDDVLTTGYEADDMSEQDSVTTGFQADDDKDETLTTGFEAEDDSPSSPTTTDFKAEDEKNEEPLATGFQADDDKDEILTTGFEAEDTEPYEPPIYAQHGDDILKHAENGFEYAREHNIDAAVSVFEFERTETIPEKDWAKIIGEITETMRKQSIDGQSVTQVGEGRYSFIHDKKRGIDALKKKVSDVAKKIAGDAAQAIVSSVTMDADLSEISTKHAAQSLLHVIQNPKKLDDIPKYKSLKKKHKELRDSKNENLERIKSKIERVDFTLYFQPISNIKTHNVFQYDVFSDIGHDNPLEWSLLSEQPDMLSKLDSAVCDRIIHYIKHKGGGSRSRFSIRLSQQFLTQKNHLKAFYEKLSHHPDIKERLAFETESAGILFNINHGKALIHKINGSGFTAGLGDFPLDEPSLEALNDLPVSFIKTDYPQIAAQLKSPAGLALIQKTVEFCKKRDISIIATGVDTDSCVSKLSELGIEFGQGQLCGTVESAPKFIPPTTYS